MLHSVDSGKNRVPRRKVDPLMRSPCRLLIASLLLFAPLCLASDAGKATYDVSCIHCHGSEGQGSSVSDRFWKMRIPRLNSAYVQSKSDAELKDVILNGKRKMPPAMAGNPESQHQTKVVAEQVPELITYIRSLKSK